MSGVGEPVGQIIREVGEPVALPDADLWPPEQDVFWRVVKSFLPAGTVLRVDRSPLGHLDVQAWAPDEIRAWQVPPSIVEDPPQASNLGRSMAAMFEPDE